MSVLLTRSHGLMSSARKALLASACVLLAAGVVLSPAAAQQSVKIGINNLPATRGDPTTSLTYQFLYVWQAMFDSLTLVNEAGKATPALAESWRNVSPTHWQFKLRPGVAFHNGEALTADAIVQAIEVMISDEGKAKSGPVFGTLRAISGARKVDDLTVEVTTATPAPILPNEIAALKIAAPKAWASLGREGFSRNPAGTGPFQQVVWDDNKVALKRAETSWHKAKLDSIDILFLPELASREQAFTSGQIDLAWSLAPDSKEKVERAGGRLLVVPTPSINALLFHAQKAGPTADKRVRQALNYALDKSYTETLLRGLTTSASQPAGKTVRGFQPDIKPYAYDPAKAKALLAEAGVANGFSGLAEITLVGSKDIFEKIASDFSKVGVNVEMRIITLPDLLARRDGRKEFDGALFNYNFGAQPSGDMMRSINSFHSCSFPRKWTCFPEIEPTIAAVNAEFDEKKRDEGLRKIAQYYHDNAPAVWMEEQIELDGVSNKIRNYKNVNWVINFTEFDVVR